MKVEIFLISIVLTISFPLIFGHGIGYEILDPVPLGEKKVALEITSSQYENPDSPNRQIQFSLFDIKSGVTIRDVTYEITAYKGNKFLFENTFKASNGIFIFDLLSSNSEKVTIEKANNSSFFESLIGIDKQIIRVYSSLFDRGGLYTFKVKITTAESFSNILNPPIKFDVGLSIPSRYVYEINDPYYGKQKVELITYYDEIKNFEYNSDNNMILFTMPFDWSKKNINQTSVVHEELIIPKTLGNLLVKEYEVFVNGKKIPDRAITIDDFSEFRRIIHIVLNKNDLLEMEPSKEWKEMRFMLKPQNGSPISTVTGNGQFRISLDLEPKDPHPAEKVKLIYNITDVFLKNRPISVDYDLELIHDNKVLYSTHKKSVASKDARNEIVFQIPMNVTGIVNVQFSNLDNNALAKVTIPIIVHKVSKTEIFVPDWIRNNAKWWADRQIDDETFVNGIEFMIKKGIIDIPITSTGTYDENIPDWIRNNAKWWADRQIDDETFVSSLQFLINNGIVSINYKSG